MLASLRIAGRSPRIVAPYHRIRLRRSYASVTDLNALPKAGDHLHGFTLQRSEHVPELELSALHFKHDKTGADYLHVARDDTNNVFSIGFKTNPPDATGVPHILEHTTLCGSEKYPVRDPFFKMIPRSLQNFMNAFTSPDHTMYPFATTNAQDFKNLMGVYLDATLHPLLKRSDFVQEGWRIGPENPKAPAKDEAGSDLVFKGVVYNEMKGQMSDATYIYFIRFMEHVFPSLNNSGGDPAKMTDLTYEQLKNFHRDHYHPSNSKIMTYGDQSVDDHLRFLGEQLAKFEKRDLEYDVKSAIDLNDGPKEIRVKGPVDPLTPQDSQFKTSVTWLAGDPNDVNESFALGLALNVLLDGYGSPLYASLIESGLGSDFSPNTGYLDMGRKAVFSVGLNGVKGEDIPKVKEAITGTIMEVVAKGLDKHKIEGNLHQLELGLKHKTAKFGLNAVQRILGKWFNGLDPFSAVAVKPMLDAFKASYAEKGYLEGLLKKHLMTDNTLSFTMEPSKTYGDEIAAEEASRLKSKIAEAVEEYPSEQEAYKQLRERELELVKEQDAGTTQNLDSLPTLRVSDIARKSKMIDVRDSTQDNNVKVQWRETATNGLTYFRALAMFKDLPSELRMLVPLFCDALMRIGTKNKPMGEIEDLIKLKTGGIGFGHFAKTSPFDIKQTEEGLSLSGFAFDGNVPAMYELIQTVLLETDFDSVNAQKMVQQLLRTNADGAVDGVAGSGHAYAMKYAEAGVSPEARIREQTAGLTQVRMITTLAAAEENPEAMAELINKLKTIQSIAVANMKAGHMRVALTCGADAVSANEAALKSFLATTSTFSLPAPKSSNSNEQAPDYAAHHRTMFNFPYQVSYSGLALPTGPYTSPQTAPHAILAKLLTHRHLHHEIREKGGAYGGGAYSKGIEGIFGMYSYRDPNPENTLKIYSEAGRWAAEKEWTDRELEEAKLGTFQRMDAPQSVNAEGMVRFLSGVDFEMEQRRREWLLDVDAKQVREAAEEISEKILGEEAYVCVLGNAKKQQFQNDGKWKVEEMGTKGEGEGSIEEEVERGEAIVGHS
ncbi:Mitochondrial presequence protease [Lecanosticta acicola]|uniref:Presequence protease, mitochondrial n=1 Tax=Lecanosticta acicola TaxID=111012 RepID=A0AAI8YZZ4_9PEZI|nr:Mitochondrial presequence protease [Lecanosticta acicola]